LSLPKIASISFLTLSFPQHERDSVRESSLKSHLKQMDFLHRKQDVQLDHEVDKPADEVLYSAAYPSPSPGKPPKVASVRLEPSSDTRPGLDQGPACQHVSESAALGLYLDSPMPKEFPVSRSNLDSESCSLSSCHSEFAPSHPQADELPPGWRCRQSRKWGRPFYYHSASGRSQWHPPTADIEQLQSSTMC
jgi:hypothetical protein